MTTNIDDLTDLLDGAGIIGKIKADAQNLREEKRTELLTRLRELEAAEKIGRASKAVATLENELRTAKAALHQAIGENASIGTSAQKLRGQLIKLADPRLQEAIWQIQSLTEKARQRFQVRYEPVRDIVTGSKQMVGKSNQDVILEILTASKQAIAQLEMLKESARPSDLDRVIEKIVNPIRDQVRLLLGV